MSLTPATPKVLFADPTLLPKNPPAAPPPAPEAAVPPAPPAQAPDSLVHRQDSVAVGEAPAEQAAPAAQPPVEDPPPELTLIQRYNDKPADSLPSQTRLTSALNVAGQVNLGSEQGKQQAQAFVQDVQPLVAPLRQGMGVPPKEPALGPRAASIPVAAPPGAPPAPASPAAPAAAAAIDLKTKTLGSLNLTELAALAKLAGAKEYPGNLEGLDEGLQKLAKLIHDGKLDKFLQAAPAKVTVAADQKTLADNLQKLVTWGGGPASLKAFAAILPKALELDPTLKPNLTQLANTCLTRQFVDGLNSLGLGALLGDAVQLSKLATALETLLSKTAADGLKEALTLNPGLLETLHTSAKILEGQKADPKLSLVPTKLLALLKTFPTESAKIPALEKRMSELSSKLAPYDKYFTDASYAKLTGAMTAFHDGSTDYKDVLAVYSLIDFMGLTQDNLKTLLTPLGLSPKAIELLDKSKFLGVLFAKPGSEAHKLLPNLLTAFSSLSDGVSDAKDFQAAMNLVTSGLFSIDALESLVPKSSSNGAIRELIEMARRGTVNQFNMGALVSAYNTLTSQGASIATMEALLKTVGDLKLPPDDILRFLRLAKTNPLMHKDTFSLLERSLAHQNDFSKFLSHQHKIPPFLLDATGKTLSFEKFLKLESAIKSLNDGKFDENDLGALFNLASLAPYDKIKDLIPAHVLGRFPAIEKLLSDFKSLSGFFAGNVNFQKALVGFLNGDVTALVKLLPSVAKGVLDATKTNGSLAAFVQIFDLGYDLETKIITAAESGGIDAFSTLNTELQTKLSATNARLQESVKRHPEIKGAVLPDITPAVPSPAPARVEELLQKHKLVKPEELALLKDPQTGPKLAKLAEVQALEELQKKRPLYEDEALKLKTLSEEIRPELDQLKRLQEVKGLQASYLEVLAKEPFVNKENQLNAELISLFESKLGAMPKESLARIKLLQGAAGSNFEALLRHPEFDAISSRLEDLRLVLLDQQVPALQIETLLKKSLLQPEFNPEALLKSLDEQLAAVAEFEKLAEQRLANLSGSLTPLEQLKAFQAGLPEIHKSLEPFARGRELKGLETLVASLFDDPRFLSEGKIKPEMLTSLLKHLEQGLNGTSLDLAKLSAQLETLHLLGPENLEKMLKLPTEQLSEALGKLTDYASFARSNPAILQRGGEKLELKAVLDDLVKTGPLKIPVHQQLAEIAEQSPELRQANASFRELLLKSGTSEEKDLKAILGGFESYLKTGVKADQLPEMLRGLDYLKNLPPDALKGIFNKDFNYRTLGPDVFKNLNGMVDRLYRVGYSAPNIQREVTELLKKGAPGILELNKQARVLGEIEKIMFGLQPEQLKDTQKIRDLHLSLRKFLGSVPEIKPEHVEALQIAIKETGRLDIAAAALNGVRPADLEALVKHPDHITAFFKKFETITAALDKAWGAVSNPPKPGTLNNPETRAAIAGLLRNERFWEKGKMLDQEVNGILRQLSKLEGDPVTANGLIKALNAMNPLQTDKAMWELLRPDKDIFKDVQSYVKEMEKVLLKTEGLKPEEILKARATLFDSLAGNIVKNLDNPAFFGEQVKLAGKISAQLGALPYKLSFEARQELSTSFMRMLNDPSFLKGKLPDADKIDAALKLLGEKLTSLKDTPAQLNDVIRGMREFSESRYIAEGLSKEGLIKGNFFEDLGKTVKTFDSASSDIGQLLGKSPLIIQRYIGLYGAKTAQKQGEELLARATSKEFDTIPGSKTPHPQAEHLKLLAIAGYGVNSLDALTSLLEVGGVELMGLGKQLALAGAEFGIELLINYYHTHADQPMPQKLKDLVKSLALASALSSDQAFEAVRKLYPQIKDRGDLVLALGESLATQDNVQLLSKSARLYFQNQVLSLNAKGFDGAALDKLMKGLEKIASAGGEMATAVGRKLATWAHELGDHPLGKVSYAKLQEWLEKLNELGAKASALAEKAGKTAEKAGQEIVARIETITEALGELAKAGNEKAVDLLRRAGQTLESLGEGLLKNQLAQGMVQAFEKATGLAREGMLKVLTELNGKIAKYASPAYDAIRTTLQKAGILAPVVKTEAKVLMQGAEFAGDAQKFEKAVARGLVGLEEAAAKKGVKTLSETLKLFKSTAYAEKFLELLAKLPPGIAEKILQSESLLKLLPNMLSRLFDIGMSVEKIAAKFATAMNKVLPLVGIGVSSYDSYRLHTIASTGYWDGQAYAHPDVRALALVGSFVNGADTAMSVAEMVLNVPSGGGASLALVGANVFFALTELGLDLMIDYYNGPPPVAMGETVREGVRMAAKACAALDPTISMDDIYVFGSVTTGQDLSLEIEALAQQGGEPTAAQKKSFTDKLQAQLANNQIGEAELARTLVREFRYSNGLNIELSPAQLGKLVDADFLKLALKMLLSDPKAEDDALIKYLIKAADPKTQDLMKSSWIEAQNLSGDELTLELGRQFDLPVSSESTAKDLQMIMGSAALPRLSPALQKQLLAMMLDESPSADQAALAQKVFAAGDESVKLEVLAKLPVAQLPALVGLLSEQDLAFIKAYQAKDATGTMLGKLFDSLLKQDKPQAALAKLFAQAPAATQAKLLEKVVASSSHKGLAAALVLQVAEAASLDLLPIDKVAKAAEPEAAARLYQHLLSKAPASKATGLAAQNIPLNGLLQAINQQLNLQPPLAVGTFSSESGVVRELVEKHKAALGKLDQTSLLRLASVLVADGSASSGLALYSFSEVLNYESSKSLISQLIAQPDNRHFSLPLAALLNAAGSGPDFAKLVSEVDLSKAAAMLVKSNDTTNLSKLLSNLIRAKDVPADKFAALVAQLPPAMMVGTLNQISKDSLPELFGQLSDAERLAVFKQVVASQGTDFSNGMGYARMLLNIPPGASLKDANSQFKLPANATAMMDVLAHPDILAKLSEGNSGGEVVSWLIAFGDRGQNERAFEYLQKSNSWMKDHSDILVAAFELADKAGLQDKDLKGKLSAKALYFLAGPLNSGGDALMRWLGVNEEFNQNIKLLEKLANLTDSEGKAALINSLLDNKTYSLLVVSWNASDVEALIDRIYEQDQSAGLIVQIKPDRFNGRFGKHAEKAMITVLNSKEGNRDLYLSSLAKEVDREQLRSFVRNAEPGRLKDAQLTIYNSFSRLDPSSDGDLIVKLAQSADAKMRAEMLKSLLGTGYNSHNALVRKILEKTLPVAETLDHLDMKLLSSRFALDPVNLQAVLDLVEKSGREAKLKEFVEGLPASALLESLAYDAGISDFKNSGDLNADIGRLLQQTDLKGLGYSVAPHMDKLFRELKASRATVNQSEIDNLIKLAGFVAPADRARLLQGVLSETFVDDADATLVEGVLSKASPADFKAILQAMGEASLKQLGKEVAETGTANSGLMIDLLERLAQTQEATLMSPVLSGTKPTELVAQLANSSPDALARLFANASEAQFLALGEQILKAGNKQALELFESMNGLKAGSSFPQKNPALRAKMLELLANQMTEFSLDEGGDKALTWLIAMGDKSSVDKAFKAFKEGWANRADIVVNAIKLARAQGVKLQERLSGETLRLMMPTLNSFADFLQSYVGNTDFAENMQLVKDLAALTDARGKAQIVNGLIDKKTLDVFGLGFYAKEVKDIIADIVGTSTSYEFVLHLDPKNVIGYFEVDKISTMLVTLAKSEQKGKDTKIQEIIKAGQSFWGSKDIATTRRFISDFVGDMPAKSLATIPGSLRLMFDTLNSTSGSITKEDYTAMVHLSQGVDADTKKYMVMQMLSRWKNLTDFVVSNSELNTALGILGKDSAGVVSKFSEAELKELVGKFSGNPQMDQLLNIFEQHADAGQLSKVLKLLSPAEIIRSLAADAKPPMVPSGDDLADLRNLLAYGAPNTGYNIQPHLQVLISKLDLARTPDLAELLATAGNLDTQAQVLQDIIPNAYYTYVSMGDAGAEPVPNTLSEAQLRVVSTGLGKSLDKGELDALLSKIGPEIKNLAASAESGSAQVKIQLQKILLILSQATEHGALRSMVKEIPPAELVSLWEGLGTAAQTKLMESLSDEDRQVFFESFVKAGKIDPVRKMLNGMDGKVKAGEKGANRDISGKLKDQMLHFLAEHLSSFPAKSADMAQAGLLLIVNAPAADQADPSSAANQLLDKAFKAILDSSYFGNGAEAIKGIIRQARHDYGVQEGMELLAGKLSPQAMGYAADSLDSFWTWLTSNEGDAENMQFIRDLARFASPEGKAGIIKALLNNWTTASRETLIAEIITGDNHQQALSKEEFARLINNLDFKQLSDEMESPSEAGRILAALVMHIDKSNKSQMNVRIREMFSDYSTWANSGSDMIQSMFERLVIRGELGKLSDLDVSSATPFRDYATEEVKTKLRPYMSLPE